MIRPHLCFLLFLASLGAAALAGSTVEIPFGFTDGFIRLEARTVEGNLPLTFLLDSGAGASVLDLRTARRLGLQVEPASMVRGVGSEAPAYRLDPVRLTAGSTALARIGLAVDLGVAAELCGRPIDGLIGIDFFRGRVVQIDYARRCLRLGEPDVISGERLPFKIVNGILCVPIGVNDSPSRWTRLDTGCNDALHWVVPRPQKSPGQLGVTLGFITDPHDTTLTSVRLGTRSLDKVKVALHGRELFPGEAGLLGNGLLSSFTVTVDWPHHAVFLRKTGG